MSQRFAKLKWVWEPTSGETKLVGVEATVVIYKYTDTRRTLELSLGHGDLQYLHLEQLKPTPHDHAAQKQALARLRFHVNQWVKRERKKYAAVQRDAKDIIKRMPKK